MVAGSGAGDQLSGATRGPPTSEREHGGKVYVCHATSAVKNSYVAVNVSQNAAEAHLRHEHKQAQGGKAPRDWVSLTTDLPSCTPDELPRPFNL